MSQYNKTVLTNAGLELAKRANAGQAKFEITRAVTSADDWSNKTIQDLEAVTTIPNIMQQGNIIDTEEVESNNSVIGVSLCFANKDLSTGYQIRIIGLYVREEGQENDFLYAVTTAVTPEYMPDFNDKVLYRFNMQMYLVIGKAQAVNVVINDGASVTHGQLDKYKSEVTANLKKIENAHKEDMSHVVKSASINGGDDILPDETGKLELVVPDPDLSKYVSLEQLTETLKSKADITAIPDKTATEEGIKQAKELAQEADTKAQNALDNKADKTTVEENLATKANASDLSALQNSTMQVIDGNSGDDILSFRDEKIRCYANVQNVKNLPDMSNKTWFYVITHTKNGWGSVTVISQDNSYWLNVLNGSSWNGWVHVANANDIASLQNTINNIESTRTPIVVGASDDNLFAFQTNQIRLYNGIGNTCKNLPPAINTSYFTVQYVFEGPNDNGIAIYRTPFNEIWIAGCNGGSYTTSLSGGSWLRLANSNDINDLQNQIQQLKDNQFEVQTFTDATAAANWEAQRQGKRMAIVNK